MMLTIIAIFLVPLQGFKCKICEAGFSETCNTISAGIIDEKTGRSKTLFKNRI
jgi:hypothetical protein